MSFFTEKPKIYHKVPMLSFWGLVLITIGSVDSVRNLPSAALFGPALVILFIVVGMTFLVPTALVSAELSNYCKKGGGIYAWVCEAFGKEIGFLAIWFQWVENIVWYPTILSFISGTITYLIMPDLAYHPLFIVGTTVFIFFVLTALNLMGIKTSSLFGSICGFFGLILPMFFIILLGALWTTQHPELIFNHMHLESFLPVLNTSHLLFSLTGIVLCFCGIEIAAVHIDHTETFKTYPKVLFISVIFLLCTLILGALSIVAVVPQHQISLISGVMQAFDYFLSAYHMHGLLKLLALSIAIGAIGSLNNWMIAPIKGVMLASQANHFPWLAKTNKYGSPHRLLMIQATLVALLSCAFILMPSLNSSYWMLTAVASQLYMLMYIIMFIAWIRINNRIIHASHKTFYGYYRTWIIALVGIGTCVLTFLAGFFPPLELKIQNNSSYLLMLFVCLCLMIVPGFFMFFIRSIDANKVGRIIKQYFLINSNNRREIEHSWLSDFYRNYIKMEN